MLKSLNYILLRFSKKNMLRSIPIYVAAVLILLLFGVKGLLITFFLTVFFVLGWTAHMLIGAVKDYRLTLRLNRMHYSQADYETLRRENKALLQVIQTRMDVREGGRGTTTGGAQRTPPAPSSARLNQSDIEEMRNRYAAEEAIENDPNAFGSSRNG